jgi:PIN domain nuclease of toxin-antitoxin system
MKILLDTDILIWALAEPAKLSEDGRMALEDPQNEILFSAASIWEITLKKRISRIIFGFAPDQIAKAAKESGFAELPVFAVVAALVEQLPLHHRDPFDHLLIAQAMSELVQQALDQIQSSVNQGSWVAPMSGAEPAKLNVDSSCLLLCGTRIGERSSHSLMREIHDE